MSVLRVTWLLLRAWFVSRRNLAAENLALWQQQLAVLSQFVKRSKLRPRDRVFWTWLMRLWPNWRSALLIVQPDTGIHWHRRGFRLYWRWKSRAGKPGRPAIEAEVRALIREMSKDNPTWGAPHIQSELALLGHDLAESTVTKYMPRPTQPPSQSWRTFLDNHVQDVAAIDFFTVPTATFRVLFCFVVPQHDRRRVVHFNVTHHPTARWAAQQMIKAFPFDEAPPDLIRDRDGVYGDCFQDRVDSMGIDQVPTAPRSPWQNPYCERVIGSIRRECLDHMIVLDERHLKRILYAYFEYYHNCRTHLSLERNSPVPREVEPPSRGDVIATAQVGGLHHRYSRAA